MLTLGIDPGLATTGYGLIRENRDKLVFVDHGIISTSKKDNSQNRLRTIYNSVKKLASDYKPRVIAIEKIFFSRNRKTALPVSQARGIMLLAAAQLKIPVVEYSPADVKVAVTGYGSADKRQIQQMVKHLLRLTDIPKPDDAADALAIAICHLHSYRMTSL
ncbi:MAG: crossover junction endodeoxyribonuclease RuvC [Candidatus Margulisbacteria bacterium]|nr:crossover junction endodeoxyribonuclease RuvC [Candidatus Margulisiibacteriota bacterium]